MNDLDDLERELGPVLRSTFRACLADPGVDRPRGVQHGREVHGWEQAWRARPSTFIEPGCVEVPRTARVVDGVDVVAFEDGVKPSSRRRVAVVIAVAASAVLLAAGLVVAPRWRGEEVPPSTQPSTTEDGVVPFPDRFPVLPAGHPMESRVTALFDGQLDWGNEPDSWVIVGRVVDDVLVDAVRIGATAASPDEAASRLGDASPGEPVEVLGSGWMLFHDVAEVTVAIGRHGPATLAIAGTDPVGTVAGLGGLAATVETSVDAQGQPFLTVNALPNGYRVIAGPEAIVPGAISARLTIPDGEGAPDPTLPDPVGDEGDGITVYVSMMDTFVMTIDGLRRVDIDGAEGWVSTTDGAPMVTWKVSDTTWATIWDAADTDAAVALARSLEFVDRATWVDRYAVPDPMYPAGPLPGMPTSSVPTAIDAGDGAPAPSTTVDTSPRLDTPVLAIVDASGTAGAADALAADLRGRGYTIAWIEPSTSRFEQTMLMPVDAPSDGSNTLLDLLGIGGFDTWSPALIAGALPDTVTDVVVLGADLLPSMAPPVVGGTDTTVP